MNARKPNKTAMMVGAAGSFSFVLSFVWRYGLIVALIPLLEELC
jgi:hypothetical protein